jgi:hypothetical protein
MLSIIKDNQARPLTPPDPEAVAQLRRRDVGGVTTGELFDSNQPACIDGDWVVPDFLQTISGLRGAGDLAFRTGIDETTANPVSWLEAWDGDTLMHRSCSAFLRKGITIRQPAVNIIMTEYGPMLTQDMECRVDDLKGSIEYWMPLTAEQTQDPRRMHLRREAPLRLEDRQTPLGVQTWELVHASAIPPGTQ